MPANPASQQRRLIPWPASDGSGRLRSWIEDTLGIGATTLNRLLASVILIVVVVLVRGVVIRWIDRRVDDPEASFRSRKLTAYVAGIVALFGLWRVWFATVGDLATFLGLVSAGLAIALADVLKNLAGWIYIITRTPFRVGDRIQVGEHIGDVVDIRAFRFSLLEIRNWVDADQPTGRIVDVPNGTVFTQASANYTAGFGFIWHEVPVLVTFESDWRRAEAIVRDAMFAVAPDPTEAAEAEVRAAAMEALIRLPQLEPGTYVSVRESGVQVTARMLIEANDRRGTDDRMWRALLDRLGDDPAVQLAYPTVRTYLADVIELQRLSRE